MKPECKISCGGVHTLGEQVKGRSLEYSVRVLPIKRVHNPPPRERERERDGEREREREKERESDIGRERVG